MNTVTIIVTMMFAKDQVLDNFGELESSICHAINKTNYGIFRMAMQYFRYSRESGKLTALAIILYSV